MSPPVVALALWSLFSGPTAARAGRVPVLVELYTSEGCSSCPPADALLLDLETSQSVDGALVVPLSLHVDYWNRLGWADPFSDHAYSERQRGYSDETGRMYTPQMVVDGKRRFIGGSRPKATAAIAAAARQPKAPAAVSAKRLDDGRVRFAVEIDPLTVPAGEVLVSLALTERRLTTDVRRGENAGRRLAHAAVVRSLRTLGAIGGEGFRGEVAVELPGDPSAFTAVAFAQETGGDRRVLAVGLLDLDGLARSR